MPHGVETIACPGGKFSKQVLQGVLVNSEKNRLPLAPSGSDQWMRLRRFTISEIAVLASRRSKTAERRCAEPIVSNYFSLDRVLDAVLTPEYHGTSLGGVPSATLESES